MRTNKQRSALFILPKVRRGESLDDGAMGELMHTFVFDNSLHERSTS